MTIVTEATVKKMAAGLFKVHCLAVMDEVQAKKQAVVITKHGQPVAKLVPVDNDSDDIYNFLAGKGTITGDVVSPALSAEEWGGLK
jgi:antitoxin (DNA-binding transcriptional repressor) of toxin-antitoxin stability system